MSRPYTPRFLNHQRCQTLVAYLKNLASSRRPLIGGVLLRRPRTAVAETRISVSSASLHELGGIRSDFQPAGSFTRRVLLDLGRYGTQYPSSPYRLRQEHFRSCPGARVPNRHEISGRRAFRVTSTQRSSRLVDLIPPCLLRGLVTRYRVRRSHQPSAQRGAGCLSLDRRIRLDKSPPDARRI